MKKFDLNIENFFENWETFHTIRELIANAIDEQLLTNTREVEILKKGNSWTIRDFGRGLRYTHLTQNENQEKLSNTSVKEKLPTTAKSVFIRLRQSK
jgi:DNA gyrase/topoisomerase IV subunit B